MSTSPIRTALPVLASTAVLALGLSACQPSSSSSETDVAKGSESIDLPSVLDEIPDREVLLTDHGAVGDGRHDDSQAFKDAIAALDKQGGGTLKIPEGTFLTGPIHLADRIELNVAEKATIRFSQDPKDYLPAVKTRFEGTEVYNYSPLIYAEGKENIAITGAGTLDGNADNEHWWPWKGKEEFGWEEGSPKQADDAAALMDMGENDVPVADRDFGDGHYLRPNMIQFYDSENILLKDVTIKDSPMWHVHPVLSTNVTVENTTIEGHGPNGDGINPESSSNVLIKENDISTGDDGIAIKSGKNNDGRRVGVPSENIHIVGNRFAEGHGAITIGSEMSGGVEGVFASGNTMDSPTLWNALRIKTNTDRGGYAKNIQFSDNEIRNAGEEVVHLTTQYVNDGEKVTSGEHIPTIEGIIIDGIRSNGGTHAIKLEGLPQCPVKDVTVTNSEFSGVDTPFDVTNVSGITVDGLTINDKPIDQLMESPAPSTAAAAEGASPAESSPAAAEC